ncbi:MAG: DUF4350 domain-containing protein [Gammaproteobacteria bacterium]|nr:DUF4350 domain-containing protein [Gammaproteobacteria bacterium]
MSNWGQVLLYLLLLLIVLAMGNWFYNNFTWVDEEKEVGFQGIAKTNNLLASEIFLRKMGVQVQQVNGLIAFRDLPSTKHTLLIATQRETINKELSQNLLKWVRAGGHLIVEARRIETGDETPLLTIDPLLEEFKIFSTVDETCGCNDEDSSENKISNEIKLEKTPENDVEEELPVIFSLNSDFSYEDKNTELKVNFPYDVTLGKKSVEPQLSWLLKDDVGQYLMQFSLEQGLITVLSSTSMFGNEHISKYDHARFLHYLVQLQNHDAGVWLVRVDDMPALWNWLWKNAWYVMFSLSILFFIWLWRAPLRFGPQLNDAQVERRSLLEHIQASGYYRWQNKQSGYLLAKVQDLLWDKIQTTHPAIRRENQEQAYMKLEEITGINNLLIKESLMLIDEINEHEFVERVRMLEMIRKHL